MNQVNQVTDPKTLYRRDAPETSVEAAEALNITSLEATVYNVILRAGAAGVISDDVRDALPFVRSYSSVTARYKALAEQGLITYTGAKRPGVSGRNQRVMVASRFANG